MLYSAAPHSHKQILAASDLEAFATQPWQRILELRLFHELSSPEEHYLRRLVRSRRAARVLA